MGVRTYENLLRKIARLYVNGEASDVMLFKASLAYAKAKSKARDCRDKWKMRKRLGQ